MRPNHLQFPYLFLSADKNKHSVWDEDLKILNYYSRQPQKKITDLPPPEHATLHN